MQWLGGWENILVTLHSKSDRLQALAITSTYLFFYLPQKIIFTSGIASHCRLHITIKLEYMSGYLFDGG